jgi:citrate lyase subunit beta / citryl-CoA lyase
MESFYQKVSHFQALPIKALRQKFPPELTSGSCKRPWRNVPTKCRSQRAEMLDRRDQTRVRSALYIPANKFSGISDRLTFRADALILDLEDTVPEADKLTARIELIAATNAIRLITDVFAVRICNLESGTIDEDLQAVFQCKPDVVVLPKADPASVTELAEVLLKASLDASIWPMIESPEAVAQVEAIAKASARVTVVLLGSVDLGKIKGAPNPACRLGADPLTGLEAERRWGPSASRVPLTELDSGLLLERKAVSETAQRLGIAALDGIFLGADSKLQHALTQSRALGFMGRSLASPRQVALANQTFT